MVGALCFSGSNQSKQRFKERGHWAKTYVGHLLCCISNHLFLVAPGGDEELITKALKYRENDESSMQNVFDSACLVPFL